MLLYYIFTLMIGVEGGYGMPAVGFTDTHAGPGIVVLASHDLRLIDVGLSLQVGYYQGKHEAYALSTYGARVQFSKHAWRVAPIVEIGADYMGRMIKNSSEYGSAFTYSLGIAFNIPADRLRVYPKFYYEGITDIETHAGFLGMRLGIAYEL